MRTFALIPIILCSLLVPALAEEFALIVSPQTPVQEISTADVQHIYLGKKTFWPDGSPILLFMQKSSPLTREFCVKVMGKSEEQFYLHWRMVIFTGQGLIPMEVENDAKMKHLVATRPGAIGYIWRSSLDGSVKELKIR